ncbi:MAG: CYTH domain-containing protein [Tannerellaceae bacterium]|nr:CYTH domain-containing protein [Tannerellaceae bacterium]
MGIEIERKFLVKGDFSPGVKRAYRIVQGYLCSAPERTVRIRIRDREAFITIKGPSSGDGLTRYEFEQPIPLADAEELLKLCEPGIIEKVRHIIPAGTHTWEVDVFHGENEGLVMAEIELKNPNEAINLPDWIGEEVTGDPRYYNSMLRKPCPE